MPPNTSLRVNSSVGLHIAKNEMSQERHPCLKIHRNCHGAKSVVGYRCRAVFTNASWSVWNLVGTFEAIALSNCSRVASTPAWLRSSVAEFRNLRCSGASRSAVQRRTVVRSGRAAPVAIVTSLRSVWLSNSTLVPTTQTYARLGSRGASAAVSAQRERWVMRKEREVLCR